MLKVLDMRRQRREFLGEVFERELKIMINFYKLKKKAGKKMVTKLEKIKPHVMEKILDDYFFKVCQNFYKR